MGRLHPHHHHLSKRLDQTTSIVLCSFSWDDGHWLSAAKVVVQRGGQRSLEFARLCKCCRPFPVSKLASYTLWRISSGQGHGWRRITNPDIFIDVHPSRSSTGPPLLQDLPPQALTSDLCFDSPSNTFPPHAVQALNFSSYSLLPVPPLSLDTLSLPLRLLQFLFQSSQLILCLTVRNQPSIVAVLLQQRQVERTLCQVSM
jgi:hypothetical protein